MEEELIDIWKMLDECICDIDMMWKFFVGVDECVESRLYEMCIKMEVVIEERDCFEDELFFFVCCKLWEMEEFK